MIQADVYLPPGTNATGRRILKSIIECRDPEIQFHAVERYTGRSPWLVLWGVGAPGRSEIRDRHIASGGRVFLWDIGFFRRCKIDGHCKVSVDQDYATKWLDGTEPLPGRWEALELELRDDYDPKGHIVLAGVGPKQHQYMAGKIDQWERDKLLELRRKYPDRRIVYRPKPQRAFIPLPCETDNKSSIEEVLRGASLAVCMHSNVAVDAVLAGVPFTSEDGVSTWLRGKPYTHDVRLDFVRRIARWQYRSDEMKLAWQFLRSRFA